MVALIKAHVYDHLHMQTSKFFVSMFWGFFCFMQWLFLDAGVVICYDTYFIAWPQGLLYQNVNFLYLQKCSLHPF